jgi:hypothetical protein
VDPSEKQHSGVADGQLRPLHIRAPIDGETAVNLPWPPPQHRNQLVAGLVRDNAQEAIPVSTSRFDRTVQPSRPATDNAASWISSLFTAHASVTMYDS